MIETPMSAEEAPPPKVRFCASGAKNRYVFVPESDLAVEELADAVAFVAHGVVAAIGLKMAQTLRSAEALMLPPAGIDTLYEQMEAGAQRHFKVVPVDEASVLPAQKPGLIIPRG